MSEITKETFPKHTQNPIFADLPEYLKDPANYKKVQKTVLEALASKHSHGEIMEWASCPACQRKFFERGEVIKKLGFSSPAQYMAWRLVHQEIKRTVPLPKYDG